MKTIKLKNNVKRALGIPCAHGFIVVQAGEVVEIGKDDLVAIKKNKTASGWLHAGLISTGDEVVKEEPNIPDNDKNPEPDPPKPTGEPVIDHVGGGWYTVSVSGIEVSQGKLRKADAEALAAQYSEE